ncbi:MAG TPA: alpha/beta hydrolase [Chthoniobacter sp.]|jgi:acetyl esterase/lipase
MRFPFLPSLLAIVCVLSAVGFAADPAPQTATNTLTDLVFDNIDYKSGDSLTDYEKTRCKLDLYLPVSGDNFPVLVWFHGGGLTGGAKDGVKSIAQRFAHEGIAVAAVNYRLSPKATYPAYLDDAAAAVAWVKAHAAEHHLDAARVFVGGHSAGAYLAYMVGLDDRWLKPYHLDPSAIAGLIPVSGQILTHYTIREERGIKDHNLVFADEDAPINHVHKDTPPCLILYADKDMVGRREGNAFLAVSLRAAGNKHVRDLLIENRTHGSIAGNMVHPGDPAAEAIVHFIADPKSASSN